MQTKKFSDLNLSKETLKAVTDMGFEIAMPIQTEAIPPLLEGKDVIGQAMTGTGKTAAFAIPAIEGVNPRLKKAQVLILCPTRELATQVAVEIGKLSKFKDGIHELPIYGGQPIMRQIQALKRGPQIIVGTPGRVLDHLSRQTLKLDAIKTVILDEADEMLNMGFVDDIEAILKFAPQERQTVLFSATMPQAILNLTKKYQKNPLFIKIEHETLTVPKITQEYFEINGVNKLDLLLLLLEMHTPRCVIIFCNTKRMVDKLIINLHSRGYYVEGLHGDMPQSKRNRIMEKFKTGKTDILIASDVAARGIDVDDVEIVFNYDIPSDEEYYVHRIGRTGRAGKKGKAYTFVHPREMHLLKSIERYTKTKIQKGKGPGQEELHKLKSEHVLTKIKDILKKDDLTLYKTSLAQAITEGFSPADIAAALFKMQFQEEKKESSDKGPKQEGRKPSYKPSSGYKQSSDRRTSEHRSSDHRPSERRMFRRKKR